jgi:DNA primase
VIPQSFIQELLVRVDIVDVVGRHVKLRKGGANWMGLCPFHGEKSPSFSVSPAKQFYHCFGCGQHGTAIDFLMAFSGYGFVDAVKDLAQDLGIKVPNEQDDRDPRAAAARARAPDLIATVERAAKFYGARLRDAPHAIDYLKRRGLSGQTAARFRIGYAPPGWQALEAEFGDYRDPNLIESGLVISPEAVPDPSPSVGSKPSSGSASEPASEPASDARTLRRRRYDRFRDRIMFPIRNARGNVIGFGGRVIDQGEPKYLNSPETPLFSKGRELYGLYEARDALRQMNAAVVVEGYMDVVMLAQHGIENVVATLGTATTPDHVRVLTRLVDRVTFAFDGDRAGRKAAWRALEASLPHATDTRRIEFLFLPTTHDPDSFVREAGAEGWAEALAEATPLSEFLLRELSSRVNLSQPEGRAQLQSQSREYIMALPAAALRQQLIRRVADSVQVGAEDLERFYGINGPSGPRARPPLRRISPQRAAAVPAVERVFGLAARHPSLAFEIPLDPGDLMPTVDPGVRWAYAESVADSACLTPAELPVEVQSWLRRLRTLPKGAAFASVLALLHDSPELLTRLSAHDVSPWASLSIDEARPEFHRSMAELVLGRLQEEIAQLVEVGLTGPGDSARYQSLQRRMLALKTAYGRVRR